MRARVVKPFRDKNEGVIRSAGDILTLSAARFAEINSTKFGVFVVEAPQKTVVKKKTTKKGAKK